MASKVSAVMQGFAPLQEFGLKDLYEQIGAKSDQEKAQIRAAFQAKCLGLKVSERNPSTELLAVKIPNSSPTRYRALPGISLEVLKDDHNNKMAVEEIKNRLSKTYPYEVLEFWVGAGQKRSVDHAPGMRKAQKAMKCLVCDSTQKVAAHIVSRKIRFWRAIDQVHESGLGLFSPEGTTRLKEILKTDRFHSGEDYVLPLCKTHDHELKNWLKVALNRNAEGRPS